MGKSDGGSAEKQKRKKSDSAKSPAKKKAARAGTIMGAFAAAASASNQTSAPILEFSEPLSATINNYDSQNINNTLVHFLSELNTKRRWVPAAAADSFVQGRTVRRRKATSSEDDDVGLSVFGYDERASSQDWTLGDEDAHRYLCQLQQLMSSRVMPTREQQQSVINIVRAHGLHGSRDLSRRAFNLLQQMAKQHPSVIVRDRETGNEARELPCVVANSNSWTLTGCCDSFSLDQFEDDPVEQRISPFQILNHLISLLHAAVIPAAGGRGLARSTALTSGDLLLLKWVQSELQRDLDCRLHVFSSVSGADLKSRKEALLQNSQLWRTFSDTLAKASQVDRKALVQRLMEIVAAPADAELLGEPQSVEECAFNPGEAASLAAHLLNMLLDLYGAAEDAGMFLKHGCIRTTTIGALENVRMVIETAMVEGLVGSGQVLRELSQKRAFLVSIKPRDRMRLLAMIVAKGHAKRRGDSVNYPNLEKLTFMFTNHGDVDAYLVADPAEALKYILDDLTTSTLAFNLVDKTADGLALLVSLLSQAAACELHGKELADVQQVLEKVVAAFGKHANATPARTLTPPAQLLLRAAQQTIVTASWLSSSETPCAVGTCAGQGMKSGITEKGQTAM